MRHIRFGLVPAFLSLAALTLYGYSAVPGSKPSAPTALATVDCSKTGVLADIAMDKVLRDRLLRQLAASSEWRVGQERGGLIVATRVEKPSGVNAPDPNFGVQVRVFLAGYRMAGRPEETALVEAGAGEAKLPVTRNELLEGDSSILAIHAGEDNESTQAIEIAELSKDGQRKMTRDALNQVIGELETFKQRSAEVEQNGFIGVLTPEGSVVSMEGAGSLKVEDGFQKGIYEVSGFVNPGEAGFITMEVNYNKTGKPIGRESLAVRTLQYVGWSNDPRQKFAFKSTVTLGVVPGTDGKDLDVTFRVVFHPLETRILLEKQQQASSWER